MAAIQPPLCRYCGKPIPKATQTLYFYQLAEGQTPLNVPGCVYVSEYPQTKAEAVKHTNMQVVSMRKFNYGPHHGRVAQIGVWDGESYQDEYFCSEKHARDMGRAAAHHGQAMPAYNTAIRAQKETAE